MTELEQNSPSPHFDVASSLPFSRYLSQLFEAKPTLRTEVEALCSQPPTAEALRNWLAHRPKDEASLKTTLRQFKQWAYSWAMLRDLIGLGNLREVMETMTLIAELAVERALAVLNEALSQRYGWPANEQGQRQQMVVIGMGKLGGRELNASSDIDLIFLYPDDGETSGIDGRNRVSNNDYFTRLGRQLINALADPDHDGIVFRVDMRLRPNGESGPLVASFTMLENYFVVQGREWERYAWIKARPLTGERWEEIEAIRRPFIFRKYLDFGAINAMRDLHQQIRREVAKKDRTDNIKLGPGGIREIEFLAQVFQLIRGGRDQSLQIRPTLSVLSLLAERNILTPAEAEQLAQAYNFLRNLEHRLQYLDDAQTHNLPANERDQALVARAMGFPDYRQLLHELTMHRERVESQFSRVFADPNSDGHPLDGLWFDIRCGACSDEQQQPHLVTLALLGYQEPANVITRLAELCQSPRYQHLPDLLKTRFDALMPRLVDASAETRAPDTTFVRMLALLEAITRRGAYLALLQQYPHALYKVARLMGSSQWAADYLRKHPVLLDELLDTRRSDEGYDWPAFHAQLDDQLAAQEPDTERQMDLLREAHHAQVFRLLMDDLTGELPLETLSDHLSLLADIMIALALKYSWKKILTRHCDTPRFTVISYGKLGGKELGYSSDLDIVFLYDDDHPDAGQNYARLATRLNTWLSAQTSAGQLFETDLRLRPNGDSGLVAVSIEAFREYQLQHAWMWEHQALTRARYSAGDAAVGMQFETIRNDILRQQRDLPKLRQEVLEMRRRMLDAHSSKGAAAEREFNLKQDPGGLIDVEFIVQYLVLAHAHDHPELCGNLGNLALLKMAAGLGLISADAAQATRTAYRKYRQLQHAMRLNGHPAVLEKSTVTAEIAAVTGLWQNVFAQAST